VSGYLSVINSITTVELLRPFYYPVIKYLPILGFTVAIVCYVDLAIAKTPAEIESIAKAVTVEINLLKAQSIGSGVIIDRQEDSYTSITNHNVVCGQTMRCKTRRSGETYVLNLSKDPQAELAEYDRAIMINPKDATAYYGRGLLKQEKLNDPQGALSDYDRAIALDPKSAIAYNNRANLKTGRLNDFQGALADYDRAIALDPKSAGAYGGRGLLKYLKLGDRSSGIADVRQSVKLAREQGNSRLLQAMLKILQLWGVGE
jgi:tetratricopeptide (TPR) repeat protein